MLDFGSRGLGLTPDLVDVLCSRAKHFILTVPISTQELKCVLKKIPEKPDKLVGGEGGVTF